MIRTNPTVIGIRHADIDFVVRATNARKEQRKEAVVSGGGYIAREPILVRGVVARDVDEGWSTVNDTRFVENPASHQSSASPVEPVAGRSRRHLDPGQRSQTDEQPHMQREEQPPTFFHPLDACDRELMEDGPLHYVTYVTPPPRTTLLPPLPITTATVPPMFADTTSPTDRLSNPPAPGLPPMRLSHFMDLPRFSTSSTLLPLTFGTAGRQLETEGSPASGSSIVPIPGSPRAPVWDSPRAAVPASPRAPVSNSPARPPVQALSPAPATPRRPRAVFPTTIPSPSPRSPAASVDNVENIPPEADPDDD